MSKQVTNSFSEQDYVLQGQGDKLSDEMVETLSDATTEVEMSVPEVWGRILALLDSAEKVSPGMFNNYCQIPFRYFSTLLRLRIHKMSEEQDNRFSILINHLTPDDLNGKIYPLVNQGGIISDYYREKRFIELHL